MTAILLRLRNRHFFALDVIALAVVPSLALALRLDGFQALPPYASALLTFTLIGLIVRLLIFWRAGLYGRYWRYASVDEIALIIVAVCIATLINTLLFFILRLLPPTPSPPLPLSPQLPRSIPLIDGLLALMAVGGSRFSGRLAERWRRRGSPRGKGVVIIGAGDAGRMIAREMQTNPQLGLEPLGFIDDDPAKQGVKIQGLPVLGDRERIAEVIRDYKPSQVIIAMPTAPGKTIRRFVELCKEAGVTARTIPGIYELLSGQVSVSQLREVQLEDLLRRQPITIDLEEVGRFLAGARVLVTGAGGSIGSELCRQIARYDPEQLILLDHGEASMFSIHRQLVTHLPHIHLAPVICDIRDKEKIMQIMGRYTPAVVFHSAAHKHVPLMELHADEAITNNIIGTQNLIEASERHGVKQFVLISTDKAVNPSSVMGVSKRVAEMLVQDMARRSRRAGEQGSRGAGEKSPCHLVTVSPCRFVAVRFGNVLGSSGSVIPIFKDQIAAGGPITVTHPEARRYFMTIPEAVQLVIQAAAMGQGGEIFVLDMGEPVKIVDLAVDLITLSGLEPGRDIDIVYTRLRPGEKLCEELFRDGERVRATKHEHILIAEADDFDGEVLREGVLELERLAREMNQEGIRRKLKELVPEYRLADDPSAQGRMASL